MFLQGAQDGATSAGNLTSFVKSIMLAGTDTEFFRWGSQGKIKGMYGAYVRGNRFADLDIEASEVEHNQV